MAERKVVPFDEFYYQLKLMYLFQKHPVYLMFIFIYIQIYNISRVIMSPAELKMQPTIHFQS
jgi:hypothetical protein